MKKITRLVLFVFLLSTFGFLNAQVGINNDNSEPDTSAGGMNGNTVAHENMPPFYTINFIIKAE